MREDGKNKVQKCHLEEGKGGEEKEKMDIRENRK